MGVNINTGLILQHAKRGSSRTLYNILQRHGDRADPLPIHVSCDKMWGYMVTSLGNRVIFAIENINRTLKKTVTLLSNYLAVLHLQINTLQLKCINLKKVQFGGGVL